MSDSIDSTKPDVCPVCGAVLSDAAGGLCPRCLLADAAQPTQVPGTAPGGEPPSPAEVTAAFPQFEIIQLIGVGGMGTVWRARQPKLGRDVALKLLPASLAERDPAFAERFEREGQLLARLHHPNIVAVHDSGRAGNFFYLVMEFVEGVNLRQAMRASRFTPAQALAIVPKICDALQYAHEEGVLHRDIKPENILLDVKGRVKLVDFGIAKLVAQPEAVPAGAVAPGVPFSSGGSLTLGDAALGTPNYMAPEQIEKPADVDHRADIYSLGVVFYELLTGELPVGKFAMPSEKSKADPRLDCIVQQALEKERERRQQSVGEMRTQVETIAGGPGEATPSVRPTILLHAVLFALVGAIFLIGIPRYMSLLVSLRTDGFHIADMPPITRFTIEIGHIWGLLVFPLMLGVDVACCFLACKRWGHRGLRLWSGSVVINLMLFVAISAVSLWLPTRKLFVQINPVTAQPSTFGPAIDLLVKEAADLDTGKVAGLPESVTNKVNITETVLDAVAWMEREGMDVFADTRTHFFGVGMRALAQDKSQWDQLTAPQVVAILDASITKVSTYVPLEPLEGSATFVIQTREGGRGLLQILGSNEDSVKIRYKLVRNGNAAVPSAEKSPAQPERVLYFPADRSLGQIFIGPARRDHDPDQIWDDWQRFAEARGKVEIPGGKDVRLDVSAEGVKDLSPLAALQPGDLQALKLTDTSTDECMKHVGKLSGLKYLSIGGENVTDTGLAHCAGLTGMIYLDASGTKITDQGLKVIGRFSRLEVLQLGHTGVTDQGLAELVGLTFLQSLALDQTAITDQAWTPLLHFRELRYLEVARTGITGARLEELGKLPKLEWLDLDGTAVADQSLSALKKITRLKMLRLSETEVTDAGLAALSDIKTLKELTLPTRITDEGIRRLNGLPSLHRLDLADNATAGKCLGLLDNLPALRELVLGSEIEDADLVNLKNFPKLEELWLEGPITDKGLQFLTVLKSLKTLTVQNSKVTDAGYSVLEKLPALEELHLPEIGDEGLRHVGNVPTLKMLDLSFNPHITDKGLSYLEHLPALEELTLNETHVHGEGLSALRKIRTLKRINMFQTELSPAGVDTLATLTSVEDFRLIGIKIAPKDLLRLQALIPASKMETSLAREEVPPKTLKAGDVAPDFSVQTLDGKTFRLADQRGKTVLLHFWAMWCAPCVASTPDLKKFEAELRAANPSFTMLSLDMDEIDARVRTHVTKHGLDWPQAVIGSGNKITNDFGVAGAPTYFVIGPDGRIVSLSRDWKEIRAAVSSIGGGRAKVNPE